MVACACYVWLVFIMVACACGGCGLRGWDLVVVMFSLG